MWKHLLTIAIVGVIMFTTNAQAGNTHVLLTGNPLTQNNNLMSWLANPAGVLFPNATYTNLNFTAPFIANGQNIIYGDLSIIAPSTFIPLTVFRSSAGSNDIWAQFGGGADTLFIRRVGGVPSFSSNTSSYNIANNDTSIFSSLTATEWVIGGGVNGRFRVSLPTRINNDLNVSGVFSIGAAAGLNKRLNITGVGTLYSLSGVTIMNSTFIRDSLKIGRNFEMNTTIGQIQEFTNGTTRTQMFMNGSGFNIVVGP